MRLAQRKKTELKAYRRHAASCPKTNPEDLKCSCPLWMYGWRDGEPIRQSMGTRNLQDAYRQIALLEDPHAPQLKPVAEAIEAYKQHNRSLEAATQRKYSNVLKNFLAYSERARLKYLADWGVEELDDYRSARKLASSTAATELTILRTFLAFSIERRWIADNPAQKIKPPRNLKPAEVVPYEPSEITRMLAACDVFGISSYERLRARAMVLVMRYTGLRVSDVATLRRDRIQNGQIFLHTKKTGGMVFLPIPKPLEDALAAVPVPRGAPAHSRCYFWNETSAQSTIVGTTERTLFSVFKRSGVKAARPHRFRHTLATEILAEGHGEQDVADILGISPAVVRKHYAKWSQSRQERINRVMRAVHAEAFGREQPSEAVQNAYSEEIKPVIN
jgi:site-specific recombinase XerD